MIGVELRTHGEISSNLEDGSVKTHLHTSPIVVKINRYIGPTFKCPFLLCFGTLSQVSIQVGMPYRTCIFENRSYYTDK